MAVAVAALGAQTGCTKSDADSATASTGYLSVPAGTSEVATWTCTGDPCPWGSSTSNPAVAWPAASDPISSRLGYTVSPAAYLPAASANGITITITSGHAHVSAGAPMASSHSRLVDLEAGDSYEVSGIAADQVISVQSDADFGYTVSSPAPPDPTPPADPTLPPPADPTPPPADPTPAPADPTPTPADPVTPPADPAPPPAPVTPPADPTPTPAPVTPPADPTPPATQPITGTSEMTTWTCTGSPCPWGASTSNPALAWPASSNPIAIRLGYAVSPAAYLPAAAANGLTITITSGDARVSAGNPQDSSHAMIATLAAGQSYVVSGIAPDQVISVQSDADFTYQITPPTPATTPPPVTPPPVTPPADPTPPPAGGGDATVVTSVPAFWRCNSPDCWGDDWLGSAINWPSWAAYQSNGRALDQSRSVFAADDTPLYPYMGSWAQGCVVTGVAGIAAVIEWQRGTDTWRKTLVHPGETHVIDLHAPEDGVMLESVDDTSIFTVSLSNCTPQPLP